MNYPSDSKELHLPGSLTVIYANGKLTFSKTCQIKNSKNYSAENSVSSIDIKVPGLTNVKVCNLSFNVKLMPVNDITHCFTDQNRAYLDYAMTGSRIKLRFFRTGDSFLPLGMSGRKKLKSFFIDEKIPRNERKLVPLFISEDDDIIWVYRKRIGEIYRVTDQTIKVLIIEGKLC